MLVDKIEPIVEDQSGIVSHSIARRHERYVVVTESELYVLNTTSKPLDLASEILRMLGSVLLGFILGIFYTSNIDVKGCIIFVVAIVMIVLGFYLKSKTKSVIDAILEKNSTTVSLDN